jgi:DNA-binding transcriptional MerR regulator
VTRQTGRARETLTLDFDAAAPPPRTTSPLRAAPIDATGVQLMLPGAPDDDAGDWDLHDVAPPRSLGGRHPSDSDSAKPTGRTGTTSGRTSPPSGRTQPVSGRTVLPSGRTELVSGRTGAASGRTGATGGGDGDLVPERDLKEIERDFPEGLTSVQVVDVFTRRGIRFSEATFRKYVQQGLLPRSRRVGRKGKHQGSLGLYPAATIRRINVIKRLQAENYTIEEIQRQFLRFRDELELVERGLRGLFDGFNEELARPHFDPGVRKQLKKDLSDAQLAADELLKQLSSIERRVVGPTERPPGGGVPGGAEDLL